MASRHFTNFADHLARGLIDFGSDSLRCLLVDAVPSEANLDTWRFADDVTTEIADDDYTAGGFSVNATVGAIDAAGDRLPIVFAAATSPAYTDSTISAVGAVLYKDTGTPGTSPLISFLDFEATVASTNGPYTVTFDTPLYIQTNPA